MKNYYDELEISKNASQEVIEKVYKVLAKKYHPDMNQGDNQKEAEEKFKTISQAYEILSNPEKREKYDLELQHTNPTISYEEYALVVNEKNQLNAQLNNVKNELNNYKSFINFNGNQHISNNSYGQTNSNFSNNNSYNSQNNNINNANNSSKRKTYYYTNTGKPASVFDYFKYRIKKFFSDIFIIFLFIVVIILAINAFLNADLFSFIYK